MKITCKRCKEEVEVPMYFYDSQIIKTSFLPTDAETYAAASRGKAICPMCGYEMNEYFHSAISERDIITLAVGRRTNYETI